MVDKISAKNSSVLQRLFEVIEQRRLEMPKDSYTTTLFLGGIEKMKSKFNEEAQELIEAAENYGVSSIKDSKCNNPINNNEKILTSPEKKHVIHEAADLMYHFLVILAACDLTLSDVEQELARRFGVSGLLEKEARTKK